jgi:indole-3-glycerol phosphate synthase
VSYLQNQLKEVELSIKQVFASGNLEKVNQLESQRNNLNKQISELITEERNKSAAIVKGKKQSSKKSISEEDDNDATP